MIDDLDELESNLIDAPPEPKGSKKKVAAAEPAPAPEAVTKNTIRILLEESNDIPPSGLFLQHNGRPYMLKPGMEVDIPLFLKEILDHAIITVPQVDPITRQVVGWRSRQKYAYRVI